MDIRFDRIFDLLCQESHLAKNAILSGFDAALQANLDSNRDGYFYTAFFQLSIGFERLLKLAVVVDHMLTNDLQAPSKNDLKKHSHRIRDLYQLAVDIRGRRPSSRLNTLTMPSDDSFQGQLLQFLTEYAMNSRYFNLNTLDRQTKSGSPIKTWWELSARVFESEFRASVREKWSLDLIYGLDHTGPVGYTSNVDFEGHVMTVVDVYWRQLVIERSAPLLIFRLIELLRPVHFLLEDLTNFSAELENRKGLKKMVIPHFEDFFYFLLANRQSTLRRKRWLSTFNK